MLIKKKQLLSFILVLSIMFCTFFSIPIKTNAATIDDAEVGAGNQNVIDAQTWLNNTYSGRAGYTPIDVDGVSYSTTFITLVKAIQIELGFPESKITGTFGSQTKAASPTFEINKTNNNNMVRILQYGLRCKGYYDTNVTGKFDDATQSQIVKLQQDAGLSDSQISKKATPLVLQAALSTEIYILAEGGNSRVQEVQRALNRDYLDYIGIQHVMVYLDQTRLILLLQHCRHVKDFQEEKMFLQMMMYMLMDVLVIQLKSVVLLSLIMEVQKNMVVQATLRVK